VYRRPEARPSVWISVSENEKNLNLGARWPHFVADKGRFLFQRRGETLLAQTPFNELHGSISPDSRWLAYASDESGKYEVYVQAFPVAKERWTISTRGGSQPRWSGNGRELMYIQSDGTLMSVPTQAVPSFVSAIPVPLFKTRLTGVDAFRLEFVPSADGKRILMSTPTDEGDRPAITVVVNWPALLKR
jgi:hypothetical protein